MNYTKTAWRAIKGHRAYSIINILGLTLGIASCLVIFLVVKYELGYDRWFSKSDRIYRVTLNGIDFNPSVSMAVVPAMRHDFPELEAVSQVLNQESMMIKVGSSMRYQEKSFAYADGQFTKVFNYHWLEGDPAKALLEPNSVVLTESLARKYFGSKEAMGQVVNADNTYNLKVTGVIRDLPGNTHLPFSALVSLETIKNDIKGMLSNFYAIPQGGAYIVLPENYPVSRLEKMMKPFIAKNWGNDVAKETNLLLQPLTDIHFDQRYLDNSISYTTSRETYWGLAAIAVLIIIIACINFMNLSTAQAIKRAKEVGVRKVLGSTRRQLIAQFLGETAVMTFFSLVLGIFITWLFLPQVAGWLDIKIDISQLMRSSVIGTILGLTVVVVLLAGLYPAFVQSAFKPALSLKSKALLSFRGLNLRKSLVVVQFAISQVMIVGTLVVAYQMDFFQNRQLGFSKDAVISFYIPDQSKTTSLKQALATNPGVKQISFSSGPPVSNDATSFRSPELGIVKDDVTTLKFIDEPYLRMFDIKLLAGENIRRNTLTGKDTVFSAVVNETMIHKLGFQDPRQAIGKQIILNGGWYTTIIGVVQDFQNESKRKKIRPCAMIYRADNFYSVSVRLQPAGMRKTISAIDKAWSALFPEQVFSYEFLDEHIAAWYRQEQKEYVAFRLFSVVAILIGCLGLYGLVAFAAAQRTKEVGIRKVLGASLKDIVVLFSREFVLLILLAFAIAAPLAYYVMHSWLQSFAYQINIGPDIFVLAILVSFIIAGCTIGWQAIKAGVVNPVKSLRSE
jgi:ABC-type antimicrobial peptide transport system permease subunit